MVPTANEVGLDTWHSVGPTTLLAPSPWSYATLQVVGGAWMALCSIVLALLIEGIAPVSPNDGNPPQKEGH